MPDLLLEKRHLATGRGAVIGIDEAGRGPWAGPVTAAAFWLNPNCFDQIPPELNDSKKLNVTINHEIDCMAYHDFRWKKMMKLPNLMQHNKYQCIYRSF